MIEMVEYFTFFRSFYEAANRLSARDKGALLTAIIEYGLYRREPRLSGMAEAMFILVRPNLDAAARHSQAGKKGGGLRRGKGRRRKMRTRLLRRKKAGFWNGKKIPFRIWKSLFPQPGKAIGK